MLLLRFFAFQCLTLVWSCATAQGQAPMVAQRPFQVESPNGSRLDPYYWLRDDTRKNPEVLAYLTAENAYFRKVSTGYAGLTNAIYKELVARIKPDDSSVPYVKGNFQYYTRYAAGHDYPVFARQPVAGGVEKILLDGNVESQRKAYFQVGARSVSPNEQLLAYQEDNTGRRQYTLKFRDLTTGHNLKDEIKGLSQSLAWASDSQTLFYVENDPLTLLATRVKRHTLGTDPASDPVVYAEDDHSFQISVRKTRDERFVVIDLTSTSTDEMRIIDAAQPLSAPTVFALRSSGISYWAEHIDARWIIRTNWQAPNFRIMSVDDQALGSRTQWRELVPHDKEVLLEGFVAFQRYLVISQRSQGLRRLRWFAWTTPQAYRFVESDEPAFTQTLAENEVVQSNELRYTYSSLTTPHSAYSVNMDTGERRLLKQQPVLGGFKAENYVTQRQLVTARDGSRIPVSIVYRRGFRQDGSAPLYQTAYGAYGRSMEASFQSMLLPLMDRGFVVALAHVRGGQEMGRSWYESGKLLQKKNSFTDFIDVTDYLVGHGYAAADKVFATGRSAGGLLMGAVANMAPEKYRGIVAHVPFVDVVTTMLDESIPLTTTEYDEWGNPNQRKFFDYMLSYSPYDNVTHKAYPAMLVTTGLHDSQVQYFEPAKWVAKLRSQKTDHNPLLLKVNLDAGHAGRSGRYARMAEQAEEMAFILNLLGQTSNVAIAGQRKKTPGARQ